MTIENAKQKIALNLCTEVLMHHHMPRPTPTAARIDETTLCVRYCLAQAVVAA